MFFKSLDSCRIIEYDVEKGNFDNAGEVTLLIKKELYKEGVSEEVLKKVSVISFESEINIRVYSIGGRITAILCPDRVEILIEDDGPGIEDLDAALKPGYSTAPPWVQDYGFGAGMGLPNIKKNSDIFEIMSRKGKGTKIRAVVLRKLEK